MERNLIISQSNRHVQGAFDDNSIVLSQENQEHHLQNIQLAINQDMIPTYYQQLCHM